VQGRIESKKRERAADEKAQAGTLKGQQRKARKRQMKQERKAERVHR